MSLIELQDVSKAFFADRHKKTAKLALDHVDLQVEEGEFVSLIGPSGCGKTVTLSMMAGFDTPTVGEVLFRGKRIEKPGPERGVVFQEYSLLPWLSVKQNVIFALQNSIRATGGHFDKQDASRRVDDALEVVGLADAADMRPNTLSGGMKQRVAIARLLAMDSEVFLMDEPFSALDEQTRHTLDTSLFDLWRERRKTIVFVTHNISEAVLMSSRIVLFSSSPGHIVEQWTLPTETDRDPTLREFAELTDEIRAHMPLHSRGFATKRE